MIEITLPDGSVKEVESGTTALDVAMGISEGLARNVLAAEVAGEVVDPQRPITESSSLKLLTWRDKEGKNTMWHSSAHLLAEALSSLFDGIKFWVGPPVEFGFYFPQLRESLFPPSPNSRRIRCTSLVYLNREG